MTTEAVKVKGSWPLTQFDEAGRLCRHEPGTNPPTYIYDAAYEVLWRAGAELRMKHAQAIKLAVAALEQECKRSAVEANMFDVLKLDTPATRNTAKRRADCRAAIEALQAPQQAPLFELEAA